MNSVPNSAKNRPGDPLEALWRWVGCPRGPRPNFASENLVRWTPLGSMMGSILRDFFQCKVSQIFYVIAGYMLDWCCIKFRAHNASSSESGMENVCF